MKNTITKVEIYSTIKNIVTNGTIEGVDNAIIDAILERMDKDIELASKKSGTSKAQAEKDKANATIQDGIVEILTQNGEMVYKDFIKAVQGKFTDLDLSPQKITANVTKLGDVVDKYEKGKGKEKKLYITLVTETTDEDTTAEDTSDEGESVTE